MDDRAVHFSTNEGRVSLLIGSFRERCHFFSRIRIITWVRMRISVQRLWSFHDQTRNADSQSCTHLFGEDHLVDHPRHNSRPTLARPGYFGNGQPGEPCPVNLGAIWGAGKNAVTSRKRATSRRTAFVQVAILWVMSVGLIGWVARAIGVTLPRSVRLRCDGDPVVVGDGGVRRVRTRVDPRTATRRNRAGQEARRLPRPKEVAEQTR